VIRPTLKLRPGEFSWPRLGTATGELSWPPAGKSRLIGKFGEGLPVKLDRE
jgi:hypothetical protein